MRLGQVAFNLYQKGVRLANLIGLRRRRPQRVLYALLQLIQVGVRSIQHTPFPQMAADADQLVIASQATTLERLTTRTVECVSDGPTVVSIVVLPHGGCPARVRHDRLGKE